MVDELLPLQLLLPRFENRKAELAAKIQSREEWLELQKIDTRNMPNDAYDDYTGMSHANDIISSNLQATSNQDNDAVDDDDDDDDAKMDNDDDEWIFEHRSPAPTDDRSAAPSPQHENINQPANPDHSEHAPQEDHGSME